MEEFLQRAKSKLNRSKRLEKVHVVIGHKSCDLDSLISAFTYAYFLDKVSPPGILCLPVLNIPRTEFNYFTETRFILEELNISESFHIFRDEINLHQLNNEGKLSLTLVGSNVLASEDKTLESAVVKVINPVEQSDAELEFQESSSSLVVKEILQEAPELITEQLAHLLRGSILFQCLAMESEKITERQEEVLSILEEKFPSLPPREDIIRVLQETQFSAPGLTIEQTILKDLKELSDGEIKVAVSTVNMTLEDCMFHRNITSHLKTFTDKYGFDVLILLASYSSEEQQPRRQIAVFSENLELCSQICCELEECQNPCLELEPFECGSDEILVYQQENPSVTCDQIVLLVKEVINRRCPEMVSNSRTSSTEAVAGSAPLSQGSSGIMELYGSDIEPQPSSVNFIENPPELNDSNQAQVDANIDLVSPDSGLATIRSSRSSKESSVFLSDDSPVGEGAGPHHSLLPGFDSYSPIPEGAVAEEQSRSGEHDKHFDVFNFDPAPMVSGQSQPSSHSADFSPEDDFFPNSDSSEGQLPTGPKEVDEIEINMSNYSSSSLLSKTGKDSLVEFDEEFDQRQESARDNSERNLNLTDFVGGESPSPERLKNIGKRIPPTPKNSIVESPPSTEEQTLFYPEEMIQNAVDTGHTGPPQSRARCSSWWGGLEIDSKNITDAWSSSEQESVFQSPESWRDHKPSPADRRASDSVFQPKSLEFSKSHPWESEFGPPVLGSRENQDQAEENLELQNLPTEKSHLPNASPQRTNHLIEDFTALWHSDQSPTAMPEPWRNPTDESEPVAVGTFPAWRAFGKEGDTKALKNTWNLHPVNSETPSVMDPNEWAMAKSGFSFPSEDLVDSSPSDVNNEAAPEVWGKRHSDSRDSILVSGNPGSNLDHVWNPSKPPKEDQNGLVDPQIRGKGYEKVDSWNLFEDGIKKGGSDVLAPWEDSFLSYKCSDYSTSNLGEDLVTSPLDTNYSTSDSYTSPTFAGDEKETENKPFDKEDGFEPKDVNFATEEAKMPPQSPQQSPRNQISSGPGHLEMWAHTDNSSEINTTHDPDKDVLQIEYTYNKNVSVEDDIGDSSQSSYDDPRMMQLYNETNRQLTLLHSSTNSQHGAPDNLDLWNRVILEDTQSTATISDMDNDLDWDDCSGGVAIPSEGQAQGYITEITEPETRFSVRQLEPWSVEYPEASQVDWELPASSEPSKEIAPEECREKSGQLVADTIWDSVMRDNNMSSLMLPSPPHITDSEQSRSVPETPGSSEKAKDCDIPNMFDASEASHSEALTPDPDNQDMWRGTLQGVTTSLTTRHENSGHFAHSDLWKSHSEGQSGAEKEDHGASDRECTGDEEVISSASGSSGKREGGQELSSPVASEHQEICVELGKTISPSAASSPDTEEVLEGVLEHKKGAYNLDSCDTQTGMSTNNLQTKATHEKYLLNHRNGEVTEVSGRMNSTENMSLSETDLEKIEKCNILEPEIMNEVPPQEFPQSSDIWDGHEENDVQDNCTSSEITENLEVKGNENSLPGAISPGNYGKGSISSEYTHSSTSSPDINDSSAALLSWRHTSSTGNNEEENQDDWSGQKREESEALTTDGQVELIPEMKEMEKNRMKEYEKHFEHKVPKFLEIWNYSVDGDSLSSLSSPETGKYSEYLGAYQERNLMVSHQGKNECDIPEIVQPEDANFISTSSSSDDDSADDEESGEKDIHLTTCQEAHSESRAQNSVKESNQFLTTADLSIQEYSENIGNSEPEDAEDESVPFYSNQQSSPDFWTFSTQLDSFDESSKFLATAEPNVQEYSDNIGNSKPAEHKSDPFHIDQQNSTDHWNSSPQLDSLSEISKFLVKGDTNTQEYSEYVGSSQPAKDKNMSNLFHDDQQSSPGSWNFSPQLHSLDESMKLLAKADPNIQECSEYISSAEPAEDGNKSDLFHDDQQSSPDTWNFSTQFDSLDESSKLLTKPDPNIQECFENVGSSEPAENENKSTPFYNNQQSSSDHWNFSPQLESLNESSKFLATASPNTQECSEYVGNAESAENENKSNLFHDNQQNGPDPWNFSPQLKLLDESSKFLDKADCNVQECSEYAGSSEPTEDENKSNPFQDNQQNSPDLWNFSPQLDSVNESSEFLAMASPNTQECPEYVGSSEPAENENKSNLLHDNQQNSLDPWNLSPQLDSLDESIKFVAKADLNVQDCSEYAGSSEPTEDENKLDSFQDNQQSSPDHWNFSPQLDSLDEFSKFLAKADPNVQECFEYVGSSEPTEDETKSDSFQDNQQSSSDHRNFSPQLDSLDEFSKFLAKADPNLQECSEYVGSSELTEDENKSDSFQDNQQSSSDHQNFTPQLDSLDEFSKFLAKADSNVQEYCEYVGSSEPTEDENKSDSFQDNQQSSPDHWNFSPQLNSLDESSKFLSEADPSIWESSEYVGSSEPIEDENKSDSSQDNQQSSPDPWNFSLQLDSLDESSKFLGKADPNIRECSEYAGSSEPVEDENKPNPFQDNQQSSPDHWNFSPQLDSLDESSKFLGKADPNIRECYEYVGSSEPTEDENKADSFHDNQQSSLDPWNFSLQLNSLDESSKVLCKADPNIRECSEYAGSSEPMEDENKPNPFQDNQQSSPDHWNFSPQLDSVDESSKFLAKADPSIQESSEYVEPAEDENKSASFQNNQQSSPDDWNFSPQLDSVDESSKFLAKADPSIQECSEYVSISEPAEDENKSKLFHYDQQSSPDHWNFSPLKETEIQITAEDWETKSSPEAVKTGDNEWQVSPQTPTQTPTQTTNNSKLEVLGFSAEGAKWWTASPEEGRPFERTFEGELSNSSNMLEMDFSVYQNVDAWGVPIHADVESIETHCTNPFKDKHQSSFLDGNEKNSYEQLWNIQPKQPDSDADELQQLEILDQIKEKDSREQIFVSPTGEELTAEMHTQQQSQGTMLPDGDQPDLTLTGETECVTSHASAFEYQETNWWEQEKPYTSEITNSSIASDNVPVVSSPTQLIKKSGSEWNDSTLSEGPQDMFVPDILHGNFQEGGQLASASPDLWMDAKQSFSVKADGENPDILTHCDHDSNSQASNSPDICHDYESKQETEHHISAWRGRAVESSELNVTEPKMDKEPSQEPGQEFVPDDSGLHSESAIPLPAISKQTNKSGMSQPDSHKVSLEPYEINDENNADLQASEIGKSPNVAPVLELSEVAIPVNENVGTSIFVTQPEPPLDGNSQLTSEGFAPENQRDARALLAHEQSLGTQSPASVTDTPLVSDVCLDVSEAAFDHSFSDASGLNTSTGTIDDVSKLTLSEGNPETPADGDAGKQDICSSEASWGDFDNDIMGQNIDEDLMKEPEYFLYGADRPVEEELLKKPLAPYTPPYDLSYLTEPTQGTEKTEEAESPKDESLGSEAAELLLSALPDGKGRENHAETRNIQPGLQLMELHIQEDSESLSLPVTEGLNVELSPSTDADWDVETDNSCSPAGGDLGPPNGANKGILNLQEEKIIPTKDPEQLKSEYKEETCTEKNEDHHASHTDYILVHHEEYSPQKPEFSRARESTFEFEESHTSSEEMRLPETQITSFPDAFKSASLKEREDHPSESLVSRDVKGSSPESPGQDQGWMVWGHNEVGDPTLEGGSCQLEAQISGSGWSAEAMEPASDPSPSKGYQMQVLGEVQPLESSAVEEASGLSSQPRKTKTQGRAGPDAVILQAVAHDNEWEMLSPQLSQKNILEVEMEEETEFLEPRARKSRPNGLLSEDVGMDTRFEEGMLSSSAADMRPEPPNSLDLDGTHPRRIKLTAPNINLSLDQGEGSILSDDNLDSPDEIDINVDELDTPDEADSFEYTGHEDPMANKDSGQESESIPEYTAEEEREDNRLWRTVVIGEQEQRIDMKVIEPYRRVISHGGYYGDGLNAIIVFAACFLPDSSRADYHYVMENLFLYVISTLELMVAEDYMIVYLNGATPRRKMPGLGWMKKCYQMIDRRLRKNLKSFIIVHPSWFIRTILAVTRPFISSKFSSKIKYVSSLSELSGLIPMDCIHIPESIVKLDEELREASEAANINLKLKEKP